MCRAAWCVFLLLLPGIPRLFSQTFTGSISGSVVDASGAAVPGAQVTLVNVGTAAERKAATNVSGDFVVSDIAPGEYRLTVQMAGFKTLEREGVRLTASERLSVERLVLQVGTVEERVTVTAQGTAVQTVSAERSAAITSSQVDNLLVRGRAVTTLLGLMPGVVDPTDGTIETPNAANTNFNVLGGRSNTNNITLDGIGVSAPGGAPNMLVTISMDTVSEVKVLLSNYQAEYGRLSGANIQVISKSGTRDFHGTASYFKRHEQFNANNFFNNRNGLGKGRYRYNTWTFNAGGPVYIPGKFNRNRDKLFFFVNYEFWPQKNTTALQTSTMPTELERAGNFSQSVDVNGALIPVRDPLSRAPLPNNIVPANRIDANGQALLKIFPQPNFLDTSISRRQYNHVTQWENENPLKLPTYKLDYNLGSKGTLSGTYSTQIGNSRAINAGGLTTPFAMVDTNNKTSRHMIGVRYQHIFSPTLINEANVGYVTTATTVTITPDTLKNIQRATFGFRAGQFNASNNPLDLVPGLSFGGVVGAAGITYDGRFPYDNGRSNADISDTVSKTWGSHTLKAGIFIQRIVQDDGPWANDFTGRFDFGRNVNNPFDSNHPYANAVLGVFNLYSEATSRPAPMILSRGVEWFVQDNWRVTRKLTLDLGVRFHWFEPFWQEDNRFAGFVLDRFDPARQVKLIQPALQGTTRVGRHPVTGQIYPAASIGAIAPGTGDLNNGIVIAAEDRSYPRGLVEVPPVQVGPRIGLAYDPFGDGKTAIRAGFGMFFQRFLGYAYTAANSYPIVQTPVVQYDTIATFRSAQGSATPPTMTSWERNMKVPTVMNMSFSIQRSIGFGTVVDVGYVGSLGRHMSWERSLQDIPLGARFDPKNADPASPRVPIPDIFLRPLVGYSDIGYREEASSSSYHSLQVTATRRFARSLEFGAAWTWSKTMDFNDAENGRVSTLVPVRVWNYGLAGYDRTHVVKVNWVWDLPTRQWGFVPARAVLNGWQVSGIASFVSGAPVSVGFSQTTAADITGTPSVGARIFVTGNPVLPKSERTFSRNFRTDVFRLPAVGTIGNAARTLLRGPGINNWDIALFKNFRIYERVRLQFRSEFYNAFNHTQFSALDASARFDAVGSQVNARLGEFTTARNPRYIQLALRVNF